MHEVSAMKPLKEKVSITIDADILKELREKSEEDDRSLSQYINLILKKHLESQAINTWFLPPCFV